MIESVDESVQRLHLTSQIVFTHLLRLRLPLSADTLSCYRKVLIGCIQDLESPRLETLELTKEIAAQISFDSLFENQPSMKKKFSTTCSNLLFEVTMHTTEISAHLEIILAIWLALSSK